VTHSYEYTKVPETEQSQTTIKQQCIRNIAFIRDGETLLDLIISSLHLADAFLVTFKGQKNGRKADTVTQWWSSEELLYPVKIWASITRRILSYRGQTKIPQSLW